MPDSACCASAAVEFDTHKMEPDSDCLAISALAFRVFSITKGEPLLQNRGRASVLWPDHTPPDARAERRSNSESLSALSSS